MRPEPGRARAPSPSWFKGFVDYLAPIVRRCWFLIIGLTFLGCSIGFTMAGNADASYEARIRVLIGPLDGEIDTLRASSVLVPTFGELATSTPVVTPTAEKFGLSADELRSSVTTSADEATRVVTIRVRDSEPDRAVAIATSLAEELQNLTTGSADPSVGRVSIVDPPRRPSEPIAAERGLTVALAAAAGLGLSLAIAIVLDLFDDRVRTARDVNGVGELPVLGTIGLPRAAGPEVFDDLVIDSAGPDGARWRSIASQAILRESGQGGRTLAVVATAVAADGSFVTVRIASALAAAGSGVTVISANMTTDSQWLPEPTTPLTFADVLADRATLELPPADPGTVRWMLGGWASTALLAPERIDKALNEITALGDIVIFDTGSLERSAPAIAYAAAAQSVLVVAPALRTTRRDVVRTIARLRGARGGVAGLLVTRRSRRPWPRIRRTTSPLDAVRGARQSATAT